MKEGVIDEKREQEKHLTTQLEKLEKELEWTQTLHEGKFVLIKEEAIKVEDMLNEERWDKMILEEKKKKEMQFAENSLEILIN